MPYLTALVACSVLFPSPLALIQDTPPEAPPPLVAPVPPVAQTPSANVDLSTPEACAQTFCAAFNRLDMKTMAQCVSGATYSPQVQLLERSLKASLAKETLLLILSKPQVKEDGDNAVIRFQLSANMPGGPQEGTQKLIREGVDWKIFCPTSEQIGSSSAQQVLAQNVLQPLARLVRYPDVVLRARQATAFSNVRLFTAVCAQSASDNDSQFCFTNATFWKEMEAYFRGLPDNLDDDIRSPLDPPGTISYKFNSSLTGKRVSHIAYPEKTVMIFEGDWKSPPFRYDGKALIGFVDGHAAFVSPEESKKLIWTISARTRIRPAKRAHSPHPAARPDR